MKKVEDVKEIETLSYGCHEPNGHMCVMEAVAYIGGEKWTDCPECVSPLLGSFMRSWNDGLPNDKDRARLLLPLVPEILGTTKAGDKERSAMAWEWLCRTWLPSWLDLVPSLQGQASILRDCPIEGILPKLLEARTDAAAAGAAAWAAAGDALKPTTEKLQASAQDLVRRMAAVERKPFELKRRLTVGGVEFGVSHD